MLAAGLSACASSAVVFLSKNYNQHRVERVALVEFNDYPYYPGSGEIAAGTFESYLLGAGYNLVERRQVNRILKEQSLSLAGSLDQTTIRSLGKILGVDALAFGSLTDFSNIRDQTVIVDMPQEQSEPIFGQVVTTQKNKNIDVQTVQNVVTGYSFTETHQLVPKIETLPANVGMSVRLVDVATGELLWSASSSDSGSDITSATQKASSELMQAVTKQLKRAAKN